MDIRTRVCMCTDADRLCIKDVYCEPYPQGVLGPHCRALAKHSSVIRTGAYNADDTFRMDGYD